MVVIGVLGYCVIGLIFLQLIFVVYYRPSYIISVQNKQNAILLDTKTLPEKPYIAIFIQMGYYNNTNWNDLLLNCVGNIVKAKSLSAQSLVFYSSQDMQVDNFNIDLHISFTSTIEVNNRLKIISDLEIFHKIDNIYTSIVENVGLDYKPFLMQLNYSISLHKNYDLVLKLHSKSNKQWLSHSIQCLCGTPSHVLSTINEFKRNNHIHMIVPHGLTFGINTPLKRLLPLLVDKYYSEAPLSRAFDPLTITKMEDLYSSIFNVPFNVPRRNLRIVAGSIFWVRFEKLHPIKFRSVLESTTTTHQFTKQYIANHGIEHIIERLIPTMILKHGGVIREMIPAPKLMAIYFPQYHAIPENDRFWGENFTEWTLLKPIEKSVDIQIQKPLDVSEGGLGYYNLTNIDIRKRQAILAKQAGIHGFVYYHYWFSGKYASKDHKVMHRIPELRLQDGEPDLPFVFSWANEPWSRRWNGNEKDILLSQEYGDAQEWEEHFYYLLQFFKHNSYIKLDGRPVFIIYRIGHGNLVRVLQPMLKLWNELAIQNGFLKGLYIISTIGSYYLKDQETSHMIRDIKEISATFQFFPVIRSSVYSDFDRASLNDIAIVPSDTQYWGTFTGFCNKPRNPNKHCNDISNPQKLHAWLQASFAAMNVNKWKTIQQNLYFIMAWNEWNEQAILEPSDRFKFGYLQTIQNVLQSIASIPAP